MQRPYRTDYPSGHVGHACTAASAILAATRRVLSGERQFADISTAGKPIASVLWHRGELVIRLRVRLKAVQHELVTATKARVEVAA